MKLATFTAGGPPELGLVQGDRIVSISRAAPSLASGMVDLIARWSLVEREVRAIGDLAADTLALSDVRLQAPIPRPGKIFAIGLNYADHIAESGMGTPEHQVWFAKATTSANGPYDAIEIPPGGYVDYEAEMVAVVGAGGRRIARKEAAAAVALRGALKDGVIDCIASDHAPHAYDEKEAAFDDAPFGVVGLETAFAVAHTELVGGGVFTLPELIRRMSTEPARIFHLAGGTLAPGSVADVTVLDLTAKWSVDPTTFHSKSRNTPFAGRALTGRADLTVVAGVIVHDLESPQTAAR